MAYNAIVYYAMLWRSVRRAAMRRETVYVDFPEYQEKYLLIGGKVYINIKGQEGSKRIGRFLRERAG